MENDQHFQPKNAEERLPNLRAAEPTDLSLMNLYLRALKKGL
ncbi:MAG TPA: hypothetical protein PK339_09685 [Flavitalea sp.]|nr:hypothetical protein [Flavitalea sp.]